MKLLIGNPTGHHDQYQCTLVVGDQTMLRGPLSLRDANRLRDALASGCRMNGYDFQHATLSAAKRRNNSRSET